ncbi:hypothetical protein LIER_22371 [Lithospermum erythrorhizon]|uniref:Uncharacterized protein n=1 Tax=Lithospermum erythrorhizon TaxID=34254 RepID=A0AAV3QX35_LITER
MEHHFLSRKHNPTPTESTFKTSLDRDFGKGKERPRKPQVSNVHDNNEHVGIFHCILDNWNKDVQKDMMEIDYEVFESSKSLETKKSALPSHPLASKPPSSSRRPPQAKIVRADIHRCGSELSKGDLVDLRSRYDIPSLVMLLCLRPTDHANSPPPELRIFFVVALSSGMCLPVHPYVGEVLSMARVGPAQLIPNMWISIVRFYSACLLAGVTHVAKFFLTSVSQCTQKDGFLYFTVRTEMKGFCEAFSSKVEPDTWRPFFFYTSVEGLPQGIPFGFMAHLKSHSALLRSAKHKADAHAFSTLWEDKLPMPLYSYTDHRVLKVADADLGALEALRVSFSVPDHAPLSPPSAPAAASDQLPLRSPSPAPSRSWSRVPLLWTLAVNASGGSGCCRFISYSNSFLSSLLGSGVSAYKPGHVFSRLFGLHGVTLQSYKELLSSYEVASGSSSRAGQLEDELKALKKEKAREEGVLQRRLKNFASEHTTKHKRYEASFRHNEVVRATLEGVQAERDSTMRGRDAIVKKRDYLRAGNDEMLQTHDRLLDQLTESQFQAQVMEATLEGSRTDDGLEELV